MNLAARFGSGVFWRILVSVMLAGAALTLFLMHRATLVRPPEVRQRNVREIVADVDREVDTVLARFQIERRWIRKVEIPIPNAEISRTERRVSIPPEVMPVQVNQVLNAMARRYNGRAIASENLKENSVTIHIELEGYIIQTIVLKPTPDLRRGAAKDRQKKA
jgi:hypothetical protein